MPFIASLNEVKNLLGTLEKLYVPFKYQDLIFPNALRILSEIIVRSEEFFKEVHMVNLYKALVIKKEQNAFRSSLGALNSQKNYLSNFKGEGNPHPQGSAMLQLLHDFSEENSINQDGEIINEWNQAYQYIQNLNSLKKDWDDFSEIIENLTISAPNWATRWLDKNDNNNLCPPYWVKTWMHNALTGYLNDISNEADKVENLKKDQDKFERLLRLDKEKLAFAKTKLGLIWEAIQSGSVWVHVASA